MKKVYESPVAELEIIETEDIMNISGEWGDSSSDMGDDSIGDVIEIEL